MATSRTKLTDYLELSVQVPRTVGKDPNRMLRRIIIVMWILAIANFAFAAVVWWTLLHGLY